MKKVAIILLIIILSLTFFVFASKIFNTYDVSNLEKYNISKQNSYQFNYKKNTYAISNIDENTNALGIFFKQNENYYLIDKINKCTFDSVSFYTKENNVYIHCISNQDNILQYELSGPNYQKQSRKLNLNDTPNISSLHIQFNKVDDKYIYLYSKVKLDDNIKQGEQIKCSLDNYKCKYDNGYTPYHKKLDFSYKLIYKETSPKANNGKYTVYIYQNNNKVNIIITSNTNFGKMEYDVKSNKTISKDDIKIEWTTPKGNLHTQKSEDLGSVAITILNKKDQYVDYSSRIIDLQTKEVSIGSNQIIK